MNYYWRRIGKMLGLLPLEYRSTKGPVTLAGETRRITKDVLAALGMALIFIQFVIQAFKIPTGSMEDSLLVGDFLLGLKFVYGSPVPFTQQKLPGVRAPLKKDVVIFKFPGDPEFPNNEEKGYFKLLNTFIFGTVFWDKTHGGFVLHRPKDFIKRCVAVAGDTVEVKEKELYINGKPDALPPHGKHMDSRTIPYSFDTRDNFGPYVVPRKGETFTLGQLSLREFYWVRSLIYQEHPRSLLETELKIYVDDSLFSSIRQKGALYIKDTPWDWHPMEEQFGTFVREHPEKKVRLEKYLSLNGSPLTQYTLTSEAYFMMGDNRDNSLDSRYWGFVSRKFINARALILYFSWDGFEPAWNAIRFSRIGKLIF